MLTNERPESLEGFKIPVRFAPTRVSDLFIRTDAG
jgi:hypothetical protein